MPYNGSGTYSPPGASFPAVPNTLIMSTKFNNVVNDIATALSTAITKDGQTTITANLPMGGYRHTGVGAPSARDHYATVATVQDCANNYAVSGGAADVQTLTLSPAITAYSEGMLVGFRAGYTNTSSTPTLNVNGVGAKTIVMQDGSALAVGAITAGRLYLAQYYNNNWRLTLRDALPAVPAAGKILRSNGSTWVASTGTYPDSGGTAGTLLRADGTNWVATTATFPTTVTGAGRFLRASGANAWAESSITLPDAITTGQILRSDGGNTVAASTMTYLDTIAQHRIPYANNTNSLNASGELTFNDGTHTFQVLTTGGGANAIIDVTASATANAIFEAFAPNGYDAYVVLTATATASWAMGLDGSASNAFTIVNNASPTESGAAFVARTSGAVGFPVIGTTASAANAYLDNGGSPTNNLLRSTSSLRYKRDVEPVDAARIEAVMQLEPIWYRSKCEADRKDWSWYGLGAEDVAAVDPRLVHWTKQRDAEGEIIPDAPLIPDGVMYERVAVLLLGKVKQLEGRLLALEAK